MAKCKKDQKKTDFEEHFFLFFYPKPKKVKKEFFFGHRKKNMKERIRKKGESCGKEKLRKEIERETEI